MIGLSSLYAYEPVGWLIVIVVLMAAAMFGAWPGTVSAPHGAEQAVRLYEAGMLPIGSTRSRFDIRFYMVAMAFLLFDVEVALLWPWATLYVDAYPSPAPVPGRAGSRPGAALTEEVLVWGGGCLRGHLVHRVCLCLA